MAEKQWIIVTLDGQRLGPFTPAEVSSLLDQGRVDPLDQAFDASGMEPRPIIEIDVFFPKQKSTDRPQAEDTILVALNLPAESEDTPADLSGGEAPADPEVGSPKPRSRPGQYYVVENGSRSSGPYSSSEIVERYHRGRFSPVATVRKRGSKKDVPLSQFVEKKQGGTRIRRDAAMSKREEFLSSLRRLNLQTWALLSVVAAAGVVALIWAYLAKTLGTQGADSSGNRSVVIETRTDSRSGGKAGSGIHRQYQDDIPVRSDSRQVRRSPARKPVGKSRASSKKIKRPRSTKKISPGRTARATTMRGAVDRISKLRGPNGTVVTVGPLFFLPVDLRRCRVKCSLPMKDRFGGSIKVVFFKAAHGDSLRSRTRGVYLTGRLQEHGLSLLISKVR